MKEPIKLDDAQTWEPKPLSWREPARVIEAVFAAGSQHKAPMGTLMVDWMSPASGGSGRCRASSFRAWIRKTCAQLRETTP